MFFLVPGSFVVFNYQMNNKYGWHLLIIYKLAQMYTKCLIVSCGNKKAYKSVFQMLWVFRKLKMLPNYFFFV